MKKRSLALPIAPVVIFVLIMVSLIIPHGSALSVTSGKIMAEVQPGKTYTYPMTVSIGTKESATDVAVDITGFGEARDGSYETLPAADDTGPYSARPFTSVDKPVFHLNPGGQQSFILTIQVPADIGDGGRYALLYIHSGPKPVAGSNTAISTGLVLPVILTVQGSTLTSTGSITDLQIDEVVSGKTVAILTTLRNTGNVHYYGAYVNVTVVGSTGNVVALASSTPSVNALIPGYEMTIRTPLDTTIPTGTYTIKSEAKVGMTLLDAKTISLPIAMSSTTVSGGEQTHAQGTAAPTPAPSGTEGPKKIPFLPIYTPGPDNLMTVGVLCAALLLWSGRLHR